MIRIEHLRAKSLHAEVTFLSQARDAKRARDRVERQELVAEQRAGEFWRSALKAKEGQTSPPILRSGPVGQDYVASFNRIWLLHGEVQRARSQYSATQRVLNAALADIATSRRRIDTLSNLIAKATRQQSARKECQHSEEMGELCTLHTIRAARSVSRASAGFDAAGRTSPTCDPERPLRFVHVPLLATHTSFDVDRACDPKPLTRAVGTSAFNPIVVKGIEGRDGLSIACHVRGMGEVSLAISRDQGKSLRVTVEPGVSAMFELLFRERSSIHARLLAMGVPISTIAISLPAALPLVCRSKHKHYPEEFDDENSLS